MTRGECPWADDPVPPGQREYCRTCGFCKDPCCPSLWLITGRDLLNLANLGLKKMPLTCGTWRNCHSFCWLLFVCLFVNLSLLMMRKGTLCRCNSSLFAEILSVQITEVGSFSHLVSLPELFFSLPAQVSCHSGAVEEALCLGRTLTARPCSIRGWLYDLKPSCELSGEFVSIRSSPISGRRRGGR